jgi:Protein kinase domain
MAVRTREHTVAVRSARDKDTFAAGLRSFINEAKLLARFDHASLLKVHQFWEAQGTAYMVMPYYAGITFGQSLKQGGKEGRRPDEAQLRGVLMPLLDALAQMHAADCFHRDIAPDNILILPDQQPLLLDFGAARHVIKDMTRAPTVILKNGYAPVEQYGEMPDMRQGAWTDLYALGAVMQYAITGRTPPQAVSRFLQDKREALADTAAGQYSDSFLRAIDRSLAVLPQHRPQNVNEMRALLAPQAPATSSPAPVRPPAAAPAQALTKMLAPTAQTAPTAPQRAAPDAGQLPHNKPPMAVVLMGVAVAVVAALLTWLVVPRRTAALVPTPAPAPTVRVTPPMPMPMPMQAPAPVSVPEPSPTPAVVPQAEPPPVSPTLAPPVTVPSSSAPAPPPAAREVKAPPAPATTSTPRVAPPTPHFKSRHVRCDDIIARVSLGEELSAGDKAILAKECK